MTFQSLYRRYRSQRFDEVLGQDHVVTALRNAVREGRVGHGYLFSGPRGTGKTSTARILAKVLNCAAPVDGEPCTACENCTAVQEGRMVDWLQELDAASNNRIEEMRSLLERVSMGTSGRRKVYILDEVHMLSGSASNALLKTLEEPPEHVVFVLATTDPQKVLPTIRSRTQHFEFNLLPAEVLSAHVRHVIALEELDLGDDAVEHVVRVGAGSARDTLSALDQVAAAGGVLSDHTPVSDLVDAIVARDAGAGLLAVDAAVRAGRDPRVVATAAIEELRFAFLVAMGAAATGLTDAGTARAGAIAAATGPAQLTGALETLGTALIEMRQAPEARIPLEVAVVRLARGEDLASLAARVEQLEGRLAGGQAADPPPAGPSTAPPAPPADAAPPEDRLRGAGAARARLSAAPSAPAAAPGPERPATRDRPALGAVRAARGGAGSRPDEAVAAGPAPAGEAVRAVADVPTPALAAAPQAPAAGGAPTAGELQAAWGAVSEVLSPRTRALFKLGRFVEGDGRRARFALPNPAHRDHCETRRGEVVGALAAHFGRPVALELVVEAASVAPAPAPQGVLSAPPPADPEEAVDLDDLVDAPDAGAFATLRDAFPGAELVDES